MPEFETNQLIMIAAGFLFVTVILWSIATYINSRMTESADERAMEALRNRRFRKYGDASKAYKKARKKIENGNTVLIDLIHDLGDDFVGRDQAEQQITFDEAFEAVSAIRGATPRSKVVVVLHTLGGYARPAHMIALALKRHLKKSRQHNAKRDPMVVAYVPYVAMSGGTMIALSADKISMDETASLGPIDTIYGGFPSEAYDELLKAKGVEATQDVLVMLAHEAQKYDRYAAKVARDIINPAHKAKADDPNALADYLTSGKLSHSEAISPKDARELGMNISTKIPEAIYALVDARIRMIQTRVEEDETQEKAEKAEREAEVLEREQMPERLKARMVRSRTPL
ncbi:MAG: hypothetical protein GYB36_12995 [Alphaproteobacteria bacterium]|nr:hypothetical protein [Alphaproteobacteria bacterium]